MWFPARTCPWCEQKVFLNPTSRTFTKLPHVSGDSFIWRRELVPLISLRSLISILAPVAMVNRVNSGRWREGGGANLVNQGRGALGALWRPGRTHGKRLG